ncbi:MAG TPA: TlpA disulfide reductase family protein [Armatimonadota bacterium]|nr:TlpA disulfide reductase family protein [Armatimonadota bacterium]
MSPVTLKIITRSLPAARLIPTFAAAIQYSRRGARRKPFLIRSSSAIILGVSITAGLIAVPAIAADPAPAPPAAAAPTHTNAPAPAMDAAVLQLLQDMTKAYQGITSYSDTIRFTDGGTGPDTARTMVYYQEPNNLSAETMVGPDKVRAVCDGAHLFVSDTRDKSQYLKLDAPPAGFAMLGAVKAAHINFGLLPYLFGGVNPLGPFSAVVTSLKVDDPGMVDGVPVNVIDGDINPDPGVTGKLFIAIGRDDHLLRRVTIKILSPAAQASTLTETHSVKTGAGAIPAGAFSFTPPAGAAAITTLQPTLYSPALVVGASPIPFTATDLAGKSVSPSKYAGKVLLLNFWAGWAEPSEKQMPTIVSDYKKYHRQGFDIIGISMDYEAGRQAVKDYVKTTGITWPVIFDGKAWDGAVPSLYKVQRVPFNVLIGRNGKIAAVNVPTSDLEAAIQLSLGK